MTNDRLKTSATIISRVNNFIPDKADMYHPARLVEINHDW